MSEHKTMMQAMEGVSAAFKELQRAIANEVMPPLTQLNAQLVQWRRDLYLARLRRWLPWGALVFFLAVLVGWMLS